jgi:hypothetical protein
MFDHWIQFRPSRGIWRRNLPMFRRQCIHYGASCIFYADGSLIEVCAGFAVHQMGVGGFGHKIPSRAGVFTAELSALFTALRHIAEVIRPPEICLISLIA